MDVWEEEVEGGWRGGGGVHMRLRGGEVRWEVGSNVCRCEPWAE
ncbi:MAG: hypothetical protein ACKESB_01595 [Candidatus Hodgkinia cicadicola]